MSVVKTVLNLAHVSHAHKLARPFYGGFGAILMLHRVVSDNSNDEFAPNAELEITVEYLEQVLRFFHDNHWEIIDLDELLNRLESKQTQTPFVVFTFDDGYKDNLELALPVFEKYNAPLTVYITSGFIHRTHIPWWYAVELALKENQRLSLTLKNQTTVFDGEMRWMAQDAFNKIRDIFVNASVELQTALLEELVAQLSNDAKNTLNNSLMTESDVAQMAQHPLVTIGAHSESHSSLSRLSETEARHEFDISKMEIEDMTGKPVKHFCYPFGGANECGEREFRLAKDCNFLSATTTEKRNLMQQDLQNPFALPRLGVKGTQQDIKYLETHLSGFAPFLYKHLGSKP